MRRRLRLAVIARSKSAAVISGISDMFTTHGTLGTALALAASPNAR
jgi:hypothetical protein